MFARQFTLQARDIEIGQRLTHCYRITTADIEAVACGVSVTTIRKRLNVLRDAGWLSRHSPCCREVGPINEPLYSWPDDGEPNYGAISYQARTRWEKEPLRETTIYTATKKFLCYFGLPPREKIKLSQSTHDLGCTQMYWYAARRWPDLEFLGEDLFLPFRGFGEGVEDALLVSGDRIIYALEHAGSYRPERVRHFHQHVAIEREIPYFIF